MSLSEEIDKLESILMYLYANDPDNERIQDLEIAIEELCIEETQSTE